MLMNKYIRISSILPVENFQQALHSRYEQTFMSHFVNFISIALYNDYTVPTFREGTVQFYSISQSTMPVSRLSRYVRDSLEITSTKRGNFFPAASGLM